MKKHTLYSKADTPNRPRILISLFLLVSLILLNLTPIAIASPGTILNQPTQTKTETPTQTNTTENPDKEDTQTTPEKEQTEETVEPEGTDNKIESNQSNEEISTISEYTNQTIKTEEPFTNTEILNNDSSTYLSSGPSSEEEHNATPQQVTFSVIPAPDTTNTTDVNSINVITTQPYDTISAEISITSTKPSFAPAITLENEQTFILSYIDVQFIADNIVISTEQIQSLTMTLKLKKNPDDHTSLHNTQIYALSRQTNQIFSLSQSLIQKTITPFSVSNWEPIVPIEITEDEEYIYYHVETTSYYATFAIVGTELIEMQPYQTEIPQIPWTAIVLTIILSTVLLIFVLFKTGFIYQVEDSTIDKKKENSGKQTNQKWSYKVKLTSSPPDLQLLRPLPAVYFSNAPSPPQIMTASTASQNPSDEREEDPMYL
jgi:hypothetical protein